MSKKYRLLSVLSFNCGFILTLLTAQAQVGGDSWTSDSSAGRQEVRRRQSSINQPFRHMPIDMTSCRTFQYGQGTLSREPAVSILAQQCASVICSQTSCSGGARRPHSVFICGKILSQSCLF